MVALAAKAEGKRCPQCVAEGKRSRVYPGSSHTTLIAPLGGYYDEDGIWQSAPDPNVTTTNYSCSNGHHWVETW